MVSFFDNAALDDDEDTVSVHDGVKSMGNDKRSSIA